MPRAGAIFVSDILSALVVSSASNNYNTQGGEALRNIAERFRHSLMYCHPAGLTEAKQFIEIRGVLASVISILFSV